MKKSSKRRKRRTKVTPISPREVFNRDAAFENLYDYIHGMGWNASLGVVTDALNAILDDVEGIKSRREADDALVRGKMQWKPHYKRQMRV